MKTKSILILAMALSLSACGKKAATDAPTTEPAATEPAAETSKETSSNDLKNAYHNAVAVVSQGNAEMQLTQEEAEAQILAINPEMFSSENIPSDLDGTIDASHSELKKMLGDRPLPVFTAHLLEKKALGNITVAEKVLLVRALSDITNVVKLAMTDNG